MHLTVKEVKRVDSMTKNLHQQKKKSFKNFTFKNVKLIVNTFEKI